MFTVDPERRETPAEQTRRRANAGLDRRGLKHVVIAIAILFGGAALLLAADIGGIESRTTTATVVGLSDRWNMKGGHECLTQLTTGYGYAQIYTRDLCQYAFWHLGDHADVQARRSRFTKTILVETHGTIFDEAHGKPPKS